jgi:phosphoglycerate kinase
VLSQLKIKDKIYHVSTAGGALIRYLTGEELPLLNALNNSASKHNK